MFIGVITKAKYIERRVMKRFLLSSYNKQYNRGRQTNNSNSNNIEEYIDNDINSILDDISIITNDRTVPLLSSFSEYLEDNISNINNNNNEDSLHNSISNNSNNSRRSTIMNNNDNNDGNDSNDYSHQSQHPQHLLFRQNNSSNDNTISNNIPVPWYVKNKIQLVAMISNYSTSYNVVNISLVIPIIKGIIQIQQLNHNINQNNQLQKSNEEESASAIVASSLLGGMIIGQLLGGILGDIKYIGGRINAIQIVLLIQIVASIACAIFVPSPSIVSSTDTSNSTSSSTSNVFYHLAFWRFLLGVGAGGVYPLAAILSAESSVVTDTTVEQQQNQQQQQQQVEQRSQDQQQQQNFDNNTEQDETNDATEEHDDNDDDNNGNNRNSLSAQIENNARTNNNETTNNTNNTNSNNDTLHRVVLTFSTQGCGFITVPILAVILLYSIPYQLNIIWRCLLLFGSFPGIFILLFLQRYSSNTTNKVTTDHCCHRNGIDNRPIHSHDSDHGSNHLSNHDRPEQEQQLQQPSSSFRLHLRRPRRRIRRRKQHEPVSTNDDNEYDDDNDLHVHSLDNQGLDVPTANTMYPITSTNDADMTRNSHLPIDEVDGVVLQGVTNTFHSASDDTYNSPNEKVWFHSIRQEPNLIPKLIGTAMTWFLFDVLFYGNTLFQPIVIEAAFGTSSSKGNDNNTNTEVTQLDIIHLLQRTATDTLILTAIALPGYAVAGFVMKSANNNTGTTNNNDNNNETTKLTKFVSSIFYQSPRYVMLQGFFIMTILYSIIGTQWETIRHGQQTTILLLLYGLTFFFANYGPNTSTFVLPSLIFTNDSSRTTLNGICAACGKVGALIGATIFDPIAEQYGDSTVMIVCSIVSAISFIITYWFVPNTSTTTTTTSTSAATIITTTTINSNTNQYTLHNNHEEVEDDDNDIIMYINSTGSINNNQENYIDMDNEINDGTNDTTNQQQHDTLVQLESSPRSIV